MHFNLLDARYKREVPWRHEKPVLPDNYTMALKHKENTKLKLLKNPERHRTTKQWLCRIFTRGTSESCRRWNETSSWMASTPFHSHPPMEKTIKIRIVFHASAKHEGVSLDNEIFPGSKLQNDLVDILLPFRWNLIALVANTCHIYLRIRNAPPDRWYFRFLWRYLDMKSFKFKSSSKSSLTKNLHHLKLSSQFKSMPKSTRTNFQLHQTQSLNPPT